MHEVQTPETQYPVEQSVPVVQDAQFADESQYPDEQSVPVEQDAQFPDESQYPVVAVQSLLYKHATHTPEEMEH